MRLRFTVALKGAGKVKDLPSSETRAIERNVRSCMPTPLPDTTQHKKQSTAAQQAQTHQNQNKTKAPAATLSIVLVCAAAAAAAAAFNDIINT